MSRFVVVASVGTYHHPFERLATWLERWLDGSGAQLHFQHGSTRPIPGAHNREMLALPELLDLYATADALVLQGGAGGVMDARKAGRIPIVVPRVPVDDEVVDDHQVKLARRLSDLGFVHVAETEQELVDLLDGVRDGSVQTRLGAHQPSDGITRTVEMLTAPVQSGLRRQWWVRRFGGFVSSRFGAATLQGTVGGLLGAVAGLLLVAAPDRETIGLLGCVGAIVAGSYAALPAAERTRSWRPGLVLLVLSGILSLAAVAAGVTDLGPFRPLAAALLGAALGVAGTTLVHRLVGHRGGVVLVGPQDRVEEIVASWRGGPVTVLASCVWRPGAELEDDARGLTGLGERVHELVHRHHASRVVFASDTLFGSPVLRELVSDLTDIGVECVALTDGRTRLEAVRPQRLGSRPSVVVRSRGSSGSLRHVA